MAENKYFFFNSRKVAQRRLKRLVEDEKKLKRLRLESGKYAYYINDIKQIKHSLTVSEFYREFTKVYKVSQFKLEPAYGSIQPDAAFIYQDVLGRQKLGFLEVESSHNKLNVEKYEKFISSGEYRDYIKVLPIVYVVGRKVDNLKTTPVEFKEWKL